MNGTETRSRIAVFIDFDNVEIGVKSTIGGQFDIGLVLEAIKERGEIVTKIAYSDWKRAGDYSRLLTQHAIRMVQRNLTPGGDKNGADITMALDALEMAFTHDHINAFVIVGGDSDFISLVEKLKQYGRRVIVVGGRQFTSLTMQRNCHEFIAYENLVGSTRPARHAERGGAKQPAVAAQGDIAKALPLVQRALQVLSEREVTPQLGLLKSTLLQLDSTFSEREYGAGSFRDFMEKLARAGAVRLKQAGRSLLVETVDDDTPVSPQAAVEEPPAPPVEAVEEPTVSPVAVAEGIRAVQHAFAAGTPRWPMYIRQARQFLKASIENFDERRYGFGSVVDLLRAAAKEGVVRVERDRQGGMRVFPGTNLKSTGTAEGAVLPDMPEMVDVAADSAESIAPVEPVQAEVAAEPPIIDAQIEAAPEPAAPPRKRGARKTGGRKQSAAKPKETPRERRSGVPAGSAEKAAKPRARKSTRVKAAEAADHGV